MILQDFLTSALYTLREPRPAARWILAMGIPVEVTRMALVLLAVLSSLLVMLDLQLSGDQSDPLAQMVLANPMLLAGMQLLAMRVTSWLMAWVGQKFGGQGRPADALLLVVWMQAVLLVIQAAQTLAALVFPPLSSFLAFFGLAASLWMMTNFVAELHGFASRSKVFLGILGTGLGFATVLSLALALLIGVIG